MDKKQYKRANELFLEQKTQLPGVKVLESGVVMLKLGPDGAPEGTTSAACPGAAPSQSPSAAPSQSSGAAPRQSSGAAPSQSPNAAPSQNPGPHARKVCPVPASIVYVHYVGRLMDGTVFDQTDRTQLPALFRVRDLIMGWQIALTRMSEGESYRIWIPAKYAYGSARIPGIPPHSTLEFDLELVKIAQY